PAPARPLDVRRRKGGLEPLRVARDHPTGDVDLLELGASEPAAAEVPGDVDGPELAPDAAGPEPGEVRVAPGRAPEIVGRDVASSLRVVADGPGEVVVAVDDRMPRQEPARVAKRGIGRDGAKGNGHERAYQTLQPPSTTRLWPVIHAPASEARRATAPFRSAGVPVRASGFERRQRSTKPGSVPGCGIWPGERQLTVIPCSASSVARARVRLTTPPLAAW